MGENKKLGLEDIKKFTEELGDVTEMSSDELQHLETKLKFQLSVVQSYMKLSNLQD